MHKGWSFGFYFLMFAGVAAYQPFLVLYFQSLDLTGTQIGLLIGIAPLITVISVPLVTGLADRTNQHRHIMSLSILSTVIILIVIPGIESFFPLLMLIILSTITFRPVIPLSDSAIIYMLGDQKGSYGRVRLGGTLGFAVMSIIVGVLMEQYGLRMAFWSGAVLFLITLLVSQKLVHSDADQNRDSGRGDVNALLKNPHFLLFLLLGWSGGIAIVSLSSYLFPYMETLGASESTMGLALAIGTITEIPILFYFGWFVKKFNSYNILVFASAISGLRFLLLAIAPNPVFVLLTQLLNGFNIPLLVIAGITYADELAPVGFRATAQGLFNAAFGGIGIATGGFVGGLLFESLGARQMYIVLCVFSLAVIAFVSIMRGLFPAQQVQIPIASTP